MNHDMWSRDVPASLRSTRLRSRSVTRRWRSSGPIRSWPSFFRTGGSGLHSKKRQFRANPAKLFFVSQTTAQIPAVRRRVGQKWIEETTTRSLFLPSPHDDWHPFAVKSGMAGPLSRIDDGPVEEPAWRRGVRVGENQGIAGQNRLPNIRPVGQVGRTLHMDRRTRRSP